MVRLREEKILSEALSDFLIRISGGTLVSVHLEFRLAFYAGVLLLTSGLGLLLKEHLSRLGPLAIAVGIALLVFVAAGWIVRHAPPFAWGETPARHPAFDYILFLAVFAAAADLAYMEVQFTPLGAHWPWHFLWISIGAGIVSWRYDSRILFSFSLSNFCAWCGISASWMNPAMKYGHPADGSLYGNIIGCGVIFLLFGRWMHRTGRKPHFEPVATYLGWLLILSALMSGIGLTTWKELAFTFLLLSTGLSLASALYYRRYLLFAMGCVSSYIALCALFHRLHPSEIIALLWYLLTSLGLLALLLLVHRRFKEDS